MNPEEMIARIAQLESMLNKAYTDQAYGCLTRAGIEERSTIRPKAHNTVIFLDLDNMHGANERYGYTEVDRRIAESIRLSADVTIGRWYSGDELIVICNDQDAQGLAVRILDQLAQQGLSATLGVAHLDKLADSVKIAADKVQAAKLANRRGTIN